MSKNIKTQIIKISIIILVLIILILVYFYFYSKIKFLSAQIGDAERSIVILEKKRQDIDVALLATEKFKEQIQIVESSVLSEENFVNFVNTLEGFRKKSGAEFTAKEANLPTDRSNPAEFSFSLKGEFKNIFQFLFLLDNSQYSGVLRKISMHRESDDSKNFIVDVNYSIFNFKP